MLNIVTGIVVDIHYLPRVRTMKNAIRLAFLLISVTISACTPSGAATTTASPAAAQETPGTRTVPTIVERMGPAFTTWKFVEDPHIKNVGASLAFHWIELSPGATTLVYSLYPAGASLLHDADLALRSESGESRSPLEIVPLAHFDRLEVGVLRFGPRSPAARSLTLSAPGAQTDQILVTTEGQPQDLYYDSRYYGRVEEVRQNEYSIRFAGPYLFRDGSSSPESVPAAEEFATPAPEVPVRPLPAGSKPAVTREMTLQILQMDSDETHMLGIQFLNDDRIIAVVDGEARLAQPTLVPVLAASPAPYPGYPSGLTSATPYPAP